MPMPNEPSIAVRTVAACLIAATAVTLAPRPCFAAPASRDVARARAELERAVARSAAAEARAAATAAHVRRVSAELDRLVNEQEAAQARLQQRANATYRSGQLSFIELLVRAVDFADFSTRWTLLARVNESEALTIHRLKTARAKARAAANRLMALQERQAREARELELEALRARRALAASREAYAEYQRRMRAARTPAPKRQPEPGPEPQPPVRGGGSWRRSVASHYGRDFTGRGASGERIGPYSMIVAHRSLPFGTLVEFRYRGKTAVARVADRGPFVRGREWDLGPGVVRVLGFSGVHPVDYRIIGR